MQSRIYVGAASGQGILATHIPCRRLCWLRMYRPYHCLHPVGCSRHNQASPNANWMDSDSAQTAGRHTQPPAADKFITWSLYRQSYLINVVKPQNDLHTVQACSKAARTRCRYVCNESESASMQGQEKTGQSPATRHMCAPARPCTAGPKQQPLLLPA